MRTPRGARGQMIGQVQKDRKGVGLSLFQWPRRVERRGALRFNAVVVNTVARSGHALSLVLPKRERFRTGTTAKPASGESAAMSHCAHAFGLSGASGDQSSTALPSLPFARPA
jgi:hypothetical protein